MQFGCIQMPNSGYQLQDQFPFHSRPYNIAQHCDVNQPIVISSPPCIKYLSEERRMVKQIKEIGRSDLKQMSNSRTFNGKVSQLISNTPQAKTQDERTHSRNSTHNNLNDVVDNLESQWQTLKKQHGNFDQRSASNSPSQNYLINSLRQKENFDTDLSGRLHKTQSSFLSTTIKYVPNILKKVVPLSKINLAQMVQVVNCNDQSQQGENKSIESNDSMRPQKVLGSQDLKDSDHYKAIVDKYSNVYRKRNQESFSNNRNIPIMNLHESLSQNNLKSDSNCYQSVAGNGGASPALQKQGVHKNHPKKETYNKNNLKMINNASRDHSPYNDLKKSKARSEKTLFFQNDSKSRISVKRNRNEFEQQSSLQEQPHQYTYNNQSNNNPTLYQSQITYGSHLLNTQEAFQQHLNHYPMNQIKIKPELDQQNRKVIVQCNLTNMNKRLPNTNNNNPNNHSNLNTNSNSNPNTNNKYLVQRFQSKGDVKMIENQNPMHYNNNNEDRSLKRFSTLHSNNVYNLRVIEHKIKKK